MHRVLELKNETPLSPPSMIEALDGWHHGLWEARRAQHIADIADIARFRRDNLEASFQTRKAILEEQLRNAKESCVRRMKLNQVERAISEHHDALAKLTRDEGRADIMSHRVAFGILRLEA